MGLCRELLPLLNEEKHASARGEYDHLRHDCHQKAYEYLALELLVVNDRTSLWSQVLSLTIFKAMNDLEKQHMA